VRKVAVWCCKALHIHTQFAEGSLPDSPEEVLLKLPGALSEVAVKDGDARQTLHTLLTAPGLLPPLARASPAAAASATAAAPAGIIWVRAAGQQNILCSAFKTHRK
jgi:hypothetical protein